MKLVDNRKKVFFFCSLFSVFLFPVVFFILFLFFFFLGARRKKKKRVVEKEEAFLRFPSIKNKRVTMFGTILDHNSYAFSFHG